MRDRLIELFKKIEKEPAITCPAYKTDKTCKDCKYSINDSLCNHIERQVDYLLANGVVVPHCKVGDVVYQTDGVNIYENEVCEISLSKRAVIYYTENAVAFDETALGKSIFLTKEEAERALKGGEG